MKFGIDRLLQQPALRQSLKGCRLALLAHPASVADDLTHSLDALARLPDIRLTAAFGPPAWFARGQARQHDGVAGF